MNEQAGFTRTELVVVMLGLVVLVLASVPVLFKVYERRAERACIANLKQIDGACQGWALESKKFTTNTYVFADFVGYLKGSALPVCPRGGTYRPGVNIADMPRCSFPGHSL